MLMICRRCFVVFTPRYCGAVSLQKLITCVTITSALDGLTQRVSPSYIEDPKETTRLSRHLKWCRSIDQGLIRF